MALEPNSMPESGGASQTPWSISPLVPPSHGCVGDAMAPCRPSRPMQRGRRIQGGDRGAADPRRSVAASSTLQVSRAADAKAKPPSDEVAPGAAEGEGEAV
jgi:hypothetical protein